MGIFVDILFLIGGLIGLGLGAKYLVSGAVRLALRYGMSPGLVGVTIVAFGTSAPELIASVIAAAQGSVGLAFGNIVGSNIANIALVLGVTGVIKPMNCEKEVAKWDMPWLLISAFGLAGLTWLWGSGTLENGDSTPYVIQAWEGGVMIALFLGFLASSIIRARMHRNAPVPDEVAEEMATIKEGKAIVDLLVLIAGLILLTSGAWALVEGAKGIALEMGIDEVIVGLTIVAFGTSLPELATSVIAARKGHADLAVANVTGSNIQNILLCLGAAAVAAWAVGGVSVVESSALEDLPVMLGVTLLLSLFLLLGKITKSRALLFVLIYAGYTAYVISRGLQG